MSYEMPHLFKGQVIVWYSDCDKSTEPVAGMATSVGDRAITITLFDKNRVGLVPLDGVRHLSDPWLKEHRDENGAWDYHPLDLIVRDKIQGLEAKIQKLEELLNELTGGDSKKKKVA